MFQNVYYNSDNHYSGDNLEIVWGVDTSHLEVFKLLKGFKNLQNLHALIFFPVTVTGLFFCGKLLDWGKAQEALLHLYVMLLI